MENYDFDDTKKCEDCHTQKWKENDNHVEESDQINPDLERKLHKIAIKEGFVTYKIYAKNRIPDGNNLLGVLTEVTIKGTTNNGNKELDIFVKSIISGKETIKIMKVDELYRSEVYVYIELSKIFNELQEKANVPREERYKFVKCYTESNNEFIIMENVAKKNFGVYGRYDVATLEYAKKCIEQLAKFHALSFVLERRQTNYFNDHIKKLKFPVDFGDEWKDFLMRMCNSSLEYLDEPAKNKFKNVLPSVAEILKSGYNPGPGNIKCLCHGDFKLNNILGRENNGEIEIIPVDYQLLHYGSPFIDIWFFIFTATDREFRRKHFDYLTNFYYETMEKFMKKFDLYTEDFLPKAKYEQYFKDHLLVGLIFAAWILPLILADEDDVADLGKTSLSDLDFVKNNRVKVRFQEIVDDFIDWGYL